MHSAKLMFESFLDRADCNTTPIECWDNQLCWMIINCIAIYNRLHYCWAFNYIVIFGENSTDSGTVIFLSYSLIVKKWEMCMWSFLSDIWLSQYVLFICLCLYMSSTRGQAWSVNQLLWLIFHLSNPHGFLFPG